MFEKGSKILIIGDSITDCGRGRPIGEGNALGGGYVSYIDTFLRVAYPELGLRVVNTGISGDTVRSLDARWDNDVIAQKPDYLGVMIGVNDVWRQYDNPNVKEWGVPVEEYEATYRKLLEKTSKTAVRKIYLMTPFFLELNPSDAFRATLEKYIQVVKKLAVEYNCVLIDIQAAFEDYMRRGVYSMTISGDRVHPNNAGGMLIAKTFLKAVGFDFSLL